MSTGNILYLSIGFTVAFCLLAYTFLTPGDQLLAAYLGGFTMGHVLMMTIIHFMERT